MNQNIIDLNETNFRQEVFSQNDPVLIHFWADWSEPCRSMGWLGSVAERSARPIKVARLNVEQYEALTDECGVKAVPTLLLFDRGVVREQITGRVTEGEVRDKLERLI